LANKTPEAFVLDSKLVAADGQVRNGVKARLVSDGRIRETEKQQSLHFIGATLKQID
jgi:hypothetical protein